MGMATRMMHITPVRRALHLMTNMAVKSHLLDKPSELVQSHGLPTNFVKDLVLEAHVFVHLLIENFALNEGITFTSNACPNLPLRSVFSARF